MDIYNKSKHALDTVGMVVEQKTKELLAETTTQILANLQPYIEKANFIFNELHRWYISIPLNHKCALFFKEDGVYIQTPFGYKYTLQNLPEGYALGKDGIISTWDANKMYKKIEDEFNCIIMSAIKINQDALLKIGNNYASFEKKCTLCKGE